MRKLLIALAACALSVPATAQQVLNFRDADIRAFINDASRVTGRPFVIDSRVQGKVSVFTEKPVSRSEYFEIFLSTLRANGYIAVPTSAGGYRIQPIANAASQPTRIGTRRAANNSVVTEVFRLRSIEAASAIETLRPLVSPEGSITANRNGNSLVVVDFADNVRRIRQLIGELDRRGADASTSRVIALRNAGAREIAEALTALNAGNTEGGRGAVTVVPIDSSNSVALRGDAAAIARFAAIIADLDARAASGSEIRVLFLEHADAEKLVPVLQELVGQARTTTVSSPTLTPASDARRNSRIVAPQATPPAPTQVTSTAPATGGGAGGGGGRGATVVTRYEGANAVIISGPADIQRTLGEVVRQLDMRTAQVLIEAIIIEISDGAAQRLGVQLLLGGLSGNIPIAATNYSNSTPNILTIGGALASRQLDRTTTVINGNTVTTGSSNATSDTLAQAAVSSILATTGGVAGFALDVGKDAIFGAIINAVKSDTKSRILQSPYLVTLDNTPARFLVGQEIPITTGEALSPNLDNTFRTVQRQNVGITLEVTPQINAGGEVKLTLRQEISSIAGSAGGTANDFILNKREVETVSIVDSGDIAAIGGLLDDNERNTIEKIPVLGDLPGVGFLFRSKSKNRAKTNLMIFIRPTILRSAADARRVASQRYGYIREAQWNQNPGVEPSLDELVRDYMGAVPPVAAQSQPGDVVVTPTPLPPSQVPPQ